MKMRIIPSSKLARCGCGGEAKMYHWASEQSDGDYSVDCDECDMTTGWVQAPPERAAEVWNRGMRNNGIEADDVKK